MIYFLIVVTVGGTSSITGPFLASILLGIADVAGKYYVPKLGAFVIYAIMIVVLIWRPQGLFARVARHGDAGHMRPCRRRRRGLSEPARRWSPAEIVFWVFAFASIWLFPGKYLIMKDTAILALFALSLDLILGYAGIISLGQAAFFGLGRIFRRPGRQIRLHQRAGHRAYLFRPASRRRSALSPAFWCCAVPT